MAKGVHVEMLWGTTDVPKLSWCWDVFMQTFVPIGRLEPLFWNLMFVPFWSIVIHFVPIGIGAHRKTAVPKRSSLPARALRHIRIVVPNPTTCITYHHLPPLGILRHILIAVPALRHLDARLLASIFVLFVPSLGTVSWTTLYDLWPLKHRSSTWEIVVPLYISWCLGTTALCPTHHAVFKTLPAIPIIPPFSG